MKAMAGRLIGREQFWPALAAGLGIALLSSLFAGRGALAVVMASEWVLNLGRLETDLEQPINSAVQAARMPWWH